MYPSIYYAVKDLFGLDWHFLNMFQSYGFCLVMAFVAAFYFGTKELKRKEQEGLMLPQTIKRLKGASAGKVKLITSAIIGFLIGYKLLFIILNFSEYTENTQFFLISIEGNLLGGFIGAFILTYLKYREYEKHKLEKPVWVEEQIYPHQHLANMTLIAAFFGMLGAKIFHNLENWDTFIADPIAALHTLNGLTAYGGLIMAASVLIYYGRKNKINVTHLFDSFAPSLMIAYAIGRVGCQISGDGDWGIANTSPKPSWLGWAPDWVWAYDYPHNVNNIGEPIVGCIGEKYCNHLVIPVFPTPFYEIVICVSLFFVLWHLRKRIATPGVLFSVYLIFNGIERFFIEKIRINTFYHINDFAFTQAELIATVLFFIGLGGIWYYSKVFKVVRY
jgi:prolipoprotein diacylglyceryltransferase